MPKRPRKTHWGERAAACNEQRGPLNCSDDLDFVTCNLCVYMAWRRGRLRDDDGRITLNMRTHRLSAAVKLR